MKKADVPAVNRILKKEYEKHHAPIIGLRRAEKARTNNPFKVLVTTILSSRTKDQTTSVVSRRLFKTVRKPDDLKRVTRKDLEKLIFPIGFYRTKAKHLKQLPKALDKLSGGKVPQTIEELCRLPGVGRKTANLVMSVAFNRPAVCVDVHVHRITNRVGLLKTRTPLETEMALRKILPVRYWKTWNSYLVSYGQTVCRPVGPRCGECSIREYCKRIGVTSRRS